EGIVIECLMAQHCRSPHLKMTTAKPSSQIAAQLPLTSPMPSMMLFASSASLGGLLLMHHLRLTEMSSENPEAYIKLRLNRRYSSIDCTCASLPSAGGVMSAIE